MHPILSNRDVLMAIVLACGLIVASALAFAAVLPEPHASFGAVEPSTLAGGSAAADIQSVAYLEGGHELPALSAAVQGEITVRTANP